MKVVDVYLFFKLKKQPKIKEKKEGSWFESDP